MKTSWLVFAFQMRPVVMELLRDLHRWFKGDVAQAKAAIRQIRDHGFRLDQAEAAVDARIQAVKDREQS